jgi:hypothetical protein
VFALVGNLIKKRLVVIDNSFCKERSPVLPMFLVAKGISRTSRHTIHTESGSRPQRGGLGIDTSKTFCAVSIPRQARE